jgi:hypothetical protein
MGLQVGLKQMLTGCSSMPHCDRKLQKEVIPKTNLHAEAHLNDLKNCIFHHTLSRAEDPAPRFTCLEDWLLHIPLQSPQPGIVESS